ncbi:hypothetical protein Landi51_09888 [Colletotrichum acutatum]
MLVLGSALPRPTVRRHEYDSPTAAPALDGMQDHIQSWIDVFQTRVDWHQSSAGGRELASSDRTYEQFGHGVKAPYTSSARVVVLKVFFSFRIPWAVPNWLHRDREARHPQLYYIMSDYELPIMSRTAAGLMERGREAQPDDQPRIIDRIERYEKREGPELQTHLAFRPLPDSPPSFNPPSDGTLTCNLQGTFLAQRFKLVRQANRIALSPVLFAQPRRPIGWFASMKKSPWIMHT